MIYTYKCISCKIEQEIVKSVSDYKRAEYCSDCDSLLNRILTPLAFQGEKVEDAFYSNSLGCKVSGLRNERQIAKNRGYIELGNEDPHKHLKPKSMDYMEGI